jgi:hypothetical protein
MTDLFYTISAYCKDSFCSLYSIFFLQLAVSVTDDDEQPDRRDNNGRWDPESEMAPEGEVVAKELGSPRLLTDDQIRGRAKESEVPSHGADPCKYEPGFPL